MASYAYGLRRCSSGLTIGPLGESRYGTPICRGRKWPTSQPACCKECERQAMRHGRMGCGALLLRGARRAQNAAQCILDGADCHDIRMRAARLCWHGRRGLHKGCRQRRDRPGPRGGHFLLDERVERLHVQRLPPDEAFPGPDGLERARRPEAKFHQGKPPGTRCSMLTSPSAVTSSNMM